jgi:hypothetical protein
MFRSQTDHHQGDTIFLLISVTISLFNAQHVSDVKTSILRSLRLICWVISWVVLLLCDACWCYIVVWLGWCGTQMQAVACRCFVCIVVCLLWWCISCESCATESFDNIMWVSQGCTYFPEIKESLKNPSCQPWVTYSKFHNEDSLVDLPPYKI